MSLWRWSVPIQCSHEACLITPSPVGAKGVYTVSHGCPAAPDIHDITHMNWGENKAMRMKKTSMASPAMPMMLPLKIFQIARFFFFHNPNFSRVGSASKRPLGTDPGFAVFLVHSLGLFWVGGG